MAKSINEVRLLGNLGQDPEVRYSANGTAVANLSLATTRRWKDKQTGQMQEQTEWHRLVAFGKTAELVGEYARKGNRLHVSGSLQTRKWEKDGEDRYTTEIVVDDFIILDRPANANGNSQGVGQGAARQANQGGNTPPAGGHGGSEGIPDDDIPFAQFGRGTIA